MTHSVPTRRSSDLAEGSGARRRAGRGHAPDLPAQRGGRGSPARPARCVLEPCPQRVPGDDRSRLRGGAMSMTDDDVVVRRQVVVDAPVDRAFALFVERFGDFKPGEHNLLGVPIAETRFEPHVGGHLYDRGEDGSECPWARVLAYEPPNRVVFSWDISPGRQQTGRAHG